MANVCQTGWMRFKDQPCSVENCPHLAHSRGYCEGHYNRWRRYGAPGGPLRSRAKSGKRPECSEDGCTRLSNALGLCFLHRRRLRDHGSAKWTPPPTREEIHCDLIGCDRPVVAKRLCRLHYEQDRRPESDAKERGACNIEACALPFYARGLCASHYARFRAGIAGEAMLKPFRKMGEGHVTKHGYVIVPAPDGHPNAMSGGQIMQHRLVMANYLGRALTDDENVHHKNGIRGDNRIQNLELWTVAQPQGQRVEDKLAWCHEFIRKYEPFLTK